MDRVMWTVVHIVNFRIMLPELVKHPRCEMMKISLCVVTTGNACLVRDYNEPETCLAQFPACVENTIYKMKIINPVDILTFLIDDPITIKKDCRLQSNYGTPISR